MEVDVDMSSGTDPESFDSDPGSPSDHGLPPAATYARRKKNSDEEDSDFVPEVDSSKKNVVSKVYAAPEKVKSLARPQAEGSFSCWTSQSPRDRGKGLYMLNPERPPCLWIPMLMQLRAAMRRKEEEEEQVSKPPAKKKKLMADAMPRSAPPASKPKPPPKGKGKSTVVAAAKKKKGSCA